MATEYLNVKQVAVILGVSTRTAWRLVASGRLPKPVYLGAKSPRWERGKLEAHIAALGKVGKP